MRTHLLFRTIYIVFGLISLVACQDNSPNPELVVTETMMEAGLEIVVTRVVRQTVQVPVEVSPVVDTPEVPVSLDISVEGNFESLDPQMSDEENAVDIMENIYAGLTRYNHATDEIEPVLAESWETTGDGLTWRFYLRDDIFWIQRKSDDRNLLDNSDEFLPVRTVTAEDVVYAIRRACDPRTPTPDVFILFIIDGCEQINETLDIKDQDLEAVAARAIDDRTLEITLTEPASHFLTMTSMWLLRPVPAELIEEMGDDWYLPENIWTSGPFVFGKGTVSGSRTLLVRNPYWPIPFSGNVDVVNILQLAPMDAYLLWEDRRLDISSIPADEQASIINRHQLKSYLVPNQAVFYLAYNFDSPAFRHPEIRRAFSWAIDREQLIREVHDDRAVPMRHFGPPGVIGAPPFDEVGIGYSPDKARQSMDSSKFGDCRLMPPITFLVSASDRALQQAELLREMWMEELGCNEEQIVIEQVQFGTLLARTRSDAGSARPDIWDLGWSSYYPDENNWLGDVLHCSDSENRQRRPCVEADDTIKSANDDIDIDKRWDLYRQAERAFFGEEAVEPITPLFVRAEYMLRHGWVDYAPATFGGEQFYTYVLDNEVKMLERTR